MVDVRSGEKLNFRMLVEELRARSNADVASHSQRFFKTAPGEYGYGDCFLGVRVPVIRRLIKPYSELPLSGIGALLKSDFHEERMAAVLLMVGQFKTQSIVRKDDIFEFYLKHTRYVNSWDLVDASAPAIVGDYLYDKSRKKLYELSESELLWDRRIAIVATFFMIKRHDTPDTFALAEVLMNDAQELIHKAVGWMLREAGKVHPDKLKSFLDKNISRMPRIMLRYAIEKFPEAERLRLLNFR